MLVNNIIDEDIINYKEVSMFIGMPFCSGKCWKELGLDCSICQNDKLRNSDLIDVDILALVKRFQDNPLSKAVVFGGLEPLDSAADVYYFIFTMRQLGLNNKVVIYTGYKEEEKDVQDFINILKEHYFTNVIIKVGRYIPNSNSRYDNILGVTLASDNQYAIEI